jgi:L-ascorbate metabolism protein UlaG (beta-lactamase superfamily)
MRIGDAINLDGIKIQMLASSHRQSVYATGYLIEFEGKILYHPGDTYLDAIKNLGRIDVFFVPIGGTYTMNVDEAVKALSIVKPKLAIPMHYNTLPEIRADPEEFRKKAVGFDVKIMRIGEELEI